MKILFLARHFTYFRNYDSALRELARKGHRIHLAVERSEAQGGQQAVETLAREYPQITYGEAPDRTEDRWSHLARRIRLGLDYLRYLDPFYDDAPLRRVRARERTPRALIALADPPVVGSAWWRGLVGRWLHALDLAVPPSSVLVDYLRAQQPDMLLITPLVDLGSQQIDYLRAARRLQIPTGLAVWSWDHLSSKAYIRECPERVLVWNETQRREAVEVHRVPPERVIVTGAQCFDHWFERQPSRSREAFCRQLGLPADKPVVLYVCTGLIKGSPLEPPFVREWLTRLRASGDPRVATAGVLVRPHPAQMAKWDGVDLSDLGPVALWGGNPIDDQSRADYFDSLYHSAAVVGLNTSAFIEAGIVGREVLTILPPRFHDNQAGTVHFKYLLQIGGGLLRVSRDFDSHVAQLSEALGRPEPSEHRHRAFLESFVRPQGLAVPATPAFVEAVESLAACRIAPRDTATAPAAWRRALLTRIVEYAARPQAEKWVLSPRELESLARTRGAAARKADLVLARTRAAEESRRLRAEQRRQQKEIGARRRLQRAAQVAAKRAAETSRAPQTPAAGRPLRVLFFGRHYTYFRNFEAVLQQLAARGHEVHLAVERSEAFGGLKMVQALADACPNVTYGEAPSRPVDDDWAWTAGQLRLGLDYLRYQHPIFDEAPTLRERARDRTPGAFVALAEKLPGIRRTRRLFTSVVARIERAIPEDPSIREYVAAHRPDVVLITPLVDLGSSQIDCLRAARGLGIPTAVCVWSWDHLSSKALLREWPDRVFVWNETQKQEAKQLHGIPSSRIVVTGAQCFDQWFGRPPTRDRAAFCAHVGLPASEPMILYVCSALISGSPVEAAFVVRWIRELRQHGSPALRACGILVRPHPSRLPEWDQVDLSGLGPVAICGANPIDAPSRADYFDSLYHSAVVAGLNTSAFIEAAIVGRPVHTIVLPEFESNQTGTVHFTYLLKAGGGLLHVAHDFADHARQIDESLSRPAHETAPFVRAFVRPHGLDVAATPLFVQSVEEMSGLRVEPGEAPALTGIWHRAADAIRRMRSDPRYEPWVYSSREVENLRSSRERARLQKEAAEARRASQRAERQREGEVRASQRAERQREAEERARQRAQRQQEAEERERQRAERQREAELRARLKTEELARRVACRAEREQRRLEKQAQREEKRARQRAEELARLEAEQQEKARRLDARAAAKQASLAEKRARVAAERRARRAEADAEASR